MLLSVVVTADAQQLTEFIRHERSVPLFGRIKGHYPVNLDGDAFNDLPIVQGCSLVVVSPVNLQPLWEFSLRMEDGLTPTDWGLCDGDALAVDARILVFGSITFGGIPHVAIEIQGGSRDRITAIINPATSQVAYEADARFTAALEFDDESYAVLYREEEPYVFIVGFLPPSPDDLRLPEAEIATFRTQKTSDLRLEEKYRSASRYDLGYAPDLFDPPADMDVDEDGYNDVALLLLDGGVPASIQVFPTLSIDRIWQFDIPAEHRPQFMRGAQGFADVDGDGERELLAGQNLAITGDGTFHVIAEDFLTLDVQDVDGDGLEDVIGLSLSDSSIGVYGAAATETASDVPDPLAMRSTLLPNYPNPFAEETTVPYFVADPDHVTLAVYDILGRRVRVLTDQLHAAGRHEVQWDGNDGSGRPLAAGTYFFRMQIGAALSSRQVVRIR